MVESGLAQSAADRELGRSHSGELHLEANRNSEIDERWEIKAESTSDKVMSVAFGVRVKGETNYKFLGTADSPPYRVLPTWDEVPNAPDLEFKAVARDLFGQKRAADFEWQRPSRVIKTEEPESIEIHPSLTRDPDSIREIARLCVLAEGTEDQTGLRRCKYKSLRR